MSKSSTGRFVWYDLATTDVESAKSFYTDILGWSVSDWEGSEMPYSMWAVGEQPVGGVMVLPEEAKKMGAPPHWLAYVAVANVDETAKLAAELGGKIYKEPTDIPTVGRFSVIADPQGAVIAAFTPEGDMPMYEGTRRNGDFSWNELNTTDYDGAWSFYQKLFGWQQTDTVDIGPEMGTYHMYQRADAEGSCGGMCNSAKVMNFPPHWLHYITVDDIDACVDKVKAKGGKLVHGPMEVPGGYRVATCEDPQGAAFAVHEGKKA